MKTLYVFLDFDGVLNSVNDDFGREYDSRLNTNLVNLFCDMIDELSKTMEVKVIVNSAWKMCQTKESFINKLNRFKELERFVGMLHDITPTSTISETMIKGFEIELYIHNSFRNIDNVDFLSIDDEKIETPHIPSIKHFRTNAINGLMSYDVEKIKRMVSKWK